MTREELKHVVDEVRLLYPGQTFVPTQTHFDAWYTYFSGCDYQMIRKAVADYTKANKEPPAISDLLTRHSKFVEDAKAKKAELKHIFDDLQSYYPNVFRGENDEKTFWTAIMSDTYEECYAKAQKIRRGVIGYTEKAGREGAEKWISLEKCITEAAKH